MKEYMNASLAPRKRAELLLREMNLDEKMGQLVGVYDNVNELNISELANGVYMLRITVPQGVTMRKVVKR